MNLRLLAAGAALAAVITPSAVLFQHRSASGSTSAQPRGDVPQFADRGPREPVAWVNGSEPGLRLGLVSVRRSGPAIVTAKVRIAAGRDVSNVRSWDGHPVDLNPGGDTLDAGGLRLVDEQHGRLHFPLYDSDGECVCTRVNHVRPGGTVDVYAKFPAPSRGTMSVALHVPGFPSFDGLRIAG